MHFLITHQKSGNFNNGPFAKKIHVTLYDIDLLTLALNDPKKFINSHSKSLQAIDECQYAPALFPALKDLVRKNKKPGQ